MQNLEVLFWFKLTKNSNALEIFSKYKPCFLVNLIKKREGIKLKFIEIIEENSSKSCFQGCLCDGALFCDSFFCVCVCLCVRIFYIHFCFVLFCFYVRVSNSVEFCWILSYCIIALRCIFFYHVSVLWVCQKSSNASYWEHLKIFHACMLLSVVEGIVSDPRIWVVHHRTFIFKLKPFQSKSFCT